MKHLIARIISAYGFTPNHIHPVEKGYRNQSFPVTLTDGRAVNVIIYKEEKDIVTKITAAHTVSSLLVPTGLPVRYPLDPRVITLTGTHNTRYAALYPYLPGTTIPWEGYTQKHIKLLGETLSNIHAALAAVDPRQCTTLPNVADEYRSIVNRMRTYMEHPDVLRAIHQKLGWHSAPDTFQRIELALTAGKRTARTHPLHMDFVRSNILFSHTHAPLTITGILDWEKAACGHPLFDIARTLAFLIVDCTYTPEASVRKYFLYSGYQKRGVSHLPRGHVVHHGVQHDLLELLIDLFLMHDLYKFLRHNPYEFLNENAHYVRTRDLLVRRGRILYL